MTSCVAVLYVFFGGCPRYKMDWEILNPLLQILVLFGNLDKYRKEASKYLFCGRKS